MTIVIYYLDTVNGLPKMVEYGQFDNGTITGKINRENITEKQVVEEYNRGYWRTAEE